MPMRWLLVLAFPLLLIGGATAGDRAGIAKFREIETSSSTFGDFSGSTDTWMTTVYVRTGSVRVGSGVMVCTKIRTSSSLRECMGTYRLAKGAIQVAGLISSRANYGLFITGSTGVYSGHLGTMSVTLIGKNPRQAFVTFYFK